MARPRRGTVHFTVYTTGGVKCMDFFQNLKSHEGHGCYAWKSQIL